MKQVISYSLYGQQLKFLVGAIKNAQLAQRFFPGFTVRFYVGNSVPTWCRSTLALFPNVEIIPVAEEENSLARMWRFRAILDPKVDVVLSRDADARLSYREVLAHQEFLDSQFDFHIIRDHPTGHGYLISAGMFACKNKGMKFFEKLWSETPLRDTYMQDQEFLSSQIYPQIAGNVLVHDPYYNYQPSEPSKKKMIPRKKINTVCHIGAALDENDVFVYRADLEMSLQESGHVKYIYDWGTDEDLNYGK
jgi:hypothetical protein